MSINCFLRRRTASVFTLATLCLTGASSLFGHYCGPPVIRCQPGDIVTYYIIADVNEDDLSLYDVDFQSDPQVAPVVFFTPISAVYGLFVYEARAVGTNKTDLFWAFPPNSAADFCIVDIRVSDEYRPGTAGSNPYSAVHGDPVNMLTGELVMEEPPDLMLGGPMRLFFARYYASGLQSDALVKSAVGNNWSHNFDWRTIVLTNRAVIVAPDGFNVHFDRAGSNWVLNRPTDLTYQLVDQGAGVVFGDPRDNRLYTFNTNGLLSSISDGRGNVHTLTYTNGLQLHQVSDGLGRSLTFKYEGAQLLRSVSDGTRTVGFGHQFLFGGQFNLTRVTNALGGVTQYTYDNFNGDGSLLTSTILPEGNTFYSQVYDASGRVLEQNRLGTNITRFFYDTNALITYATNALGNVTVYQHSRGGHFLSLKDAAGQTLTLATNSMGLRSHIASRGEGAVGIAYDPISRRTTAVTNVDGTVTSFTYTNRTVNGIVLYELASVTLPDGSTEHFTYDGSANLLSHQDRAGKFTRWTHNSRGQWVSVTNPAGGVFTFTYNPDGTLATRSNDETGTTSLFYDSLRRPTNAVAADGRSLGIDFDTLDRVVQVIDERGGTTTFAYDANDRMIAATNALAQVVRFEYDSADRLARMTDRSGRMIGVGYDGLDNPVTLTNRNANVTRFAWDSRERLESLTDPGNQSWLFGYDDESRLISRSDPLGNSIRRALNEAGFVTAVINEMDQALSIDRDVMNRAAGTTDPLGRLAMFAYDNRDLLTNTTLSAVGMAGFEQDELGLLSGMTDQNGSVWTFNSSGQGRLLEFVDPLNRTNSIQYDQRGRPRRLLFANGASQTNTYDAAGSLVEMSLSDGLHLAFNYDALNRLTNASGLLLFYDAGDRITNTVSSGVSFGAAYDTGGRLTNVTYNGGALAVTYVYDSRDRLTQVSDSLSGAQISFFYNNAGRLTNVVRANGVHGIYDYDPAGRIARIREGTFLDLQYTRDAAGEVMALDSTAPLSAAPDSSQANALLFDAAHQINSAGYAYDARGRLTASPGHTFQWNAASQLTRIDGVTNTYNGAGNIRTRSDAGGSIRYHYNHALALAPIVAEQNASNEQFLRYYVWSPSGELLYMVDASNGNAVSYFHFDQLGSTLALTSGAGAVTDSYAYSPYGVLEARSGTNPQPFSYVGRFGVRAEPAGALYHMRARYYDSQSGRFLSRDPVWPRPNEALSLNPYQYALNNPLSHLDPLGLNELRFEDLPPNVRLAVLTLGLYLYAHAYDLSSNPALTQPDGVHLLTLQHPALMALFVSMAQYLTSVQDQLYLLEYRQHLNARYNRLTAAMRMDPFGSALHLLRISRSYDPAGSYLNAGLASGMPAFQMLAAYEVAAIGTFLNRIADQRAAVATYARSVRNPVVGLLLNMYGGISGFGAPTPMTAIVPGSAIPRGVAFVNGRLVGPKLQDLIYGAIEKEKLYGDLEYWDIWPEDVVDDLLDRLESGGTRYRPAILK